MWRAGQFQRKRYGGQLERISILVATYLPIYRTEKREKGYGRYAFCENLGKTDMVPGNINVPAGIALCRDVWRC